MKFTNGRYLSVVALFKVTSVVAFCSLLLRVEVAFADDWPTYQHDPARTGRSTVNIDPMSLEKAWSAPRGYSIPLVVGNSIYSMLNGGGGDPTAITSFNAFNGSQNWSVSYLFAFPSEPTYAEGLIVFVGGTSTVKKLYVLDAATGTQKYTVDLNAITHSAAMPVVARNANNQLVAYVADAGHISAVNLGVNSGSVLWTGAGNLGGLPTLVGNSIVLDSPGHSYAFDQLTGASNQFLNMSNITGGGGSTVAFDSARKQFYLRDSYTGALTAYSYTSNSQISQLWQIPASSVPYGSVAVGPDGRLYTNGLSSLFELDPVNGNILRSQTGLLLANNSAPALSATSIFLVGDGSTEIYDLNTFSHVRSLGGSRGNSNSSYGSPGAIADFGFVLTYGIGPSDAGFDVYLVPEPAMISLTSISCMTLYAFGRRVRRLPIES